MARSKATSTTEPEPKPKSKAKAKPKSRSASASTSTSKIETGVQSQDEDEEEASHPISKPAAQSGSVSKSRPLHSTVSEIVGNRLKTIKAGRKDLIQAYLEPAAILNQLQFNQTKQLNDFLASRTSERNEIQRLVEIKRENNRNALRELVENSKRCNLWDQEDEDDESSDSESSSECSSSSSSSSSDSDSTSDDDDEDEEEGARDEEEEEIHQPSVQEGQSKGKGKEKEIVSNEDDQMDLDESDKENQDQESREIEEVIPVPGRRVMKDQAVGEGQSKHPIKTGIGFLEYLAPLPNPGLTKKGKPRKIWPKKRLEKKIQTLKIKIPKVRKKKKKKIKIKKPKKPKKKKIEKPKSKKKLKAEAKEFKLIKNQAREEYREERDKRRAQEKEEKLERKRLREEERERKRKIKEEGRWERRLDREDEMIRKKNSSQEEEEEEIKSLLKSQNPRHLDPTFYPPSLSNWPLLPDQVSRPEWSLGEDLSSVVEKEWRQRYRRELREQSKLERFREKENANFNPVSPRSKSFQSDGNDSDSSTKTNSSSVRRSGRRRTSRHSSLAASDIFDLNEEERMEIEQSEDSDDSEIYEPDQNAVDDDLDGEGPKQSKGKGKAQGTSSKRGSRSRSNSTSKTSSKKAIAATKRGKKRLRESEMEDSDLDWESDELDEDLELPKGFLGPIIPLAHSKLDSILYLLSKQTSEMIVSVEDKKTGLNKNSEEKGSEDEDDDDDDEIVDEGKLKKSISKKSKSRPLKSGTSSIASGSSSAIESDSDSSSSSSSSSSSDTSLSPSESPSDEEQDVKFKGGNFKSKYQNYPQNFKRGSNHRQIKSRASRWRNFFQSELEKNKSNWGSNEISKNVMRQMLSYSWSLMTEDEKSQYGSLEEVQNDKMDLDEDPETEQINDKQIGRERCLERPKNPKTPLRRYFENCKDPSTVDFNEDDVLRDWLALDPKEKSVYEKEYFKDFDEYQKELEIWLDNGGPQKEKEKDQARADQLEEARVKQLRRADKPSKPMNAFSRFLLDRITEAKNLPRDERMKMSELIESSKRDWKDLPKDHRKQFETFVIQDQKTYTFKMIQWRRKWGAEYSLKGRLYTDENSKPSRPILRRDQWQKSIPNWDFLTDLEKENLWQERHEQFLEYQKDHIKWKTGFLTEMSKIDVEQEAQSKWNQLKEEEKLGFESVIKEAILSMLDSDALRFKEIDHFPRSKPSLKAVQIRHLFTDHLKKVFEKRFEFKEVMKILNITNYEFHPIRIHEKLWKKLDLRIKAQLNQLAKERETIHRIEMKEWERYHGNVDPTATSRLNNPIKDEKSAPDRKLDYKDVVEIISRLQRKDEKLGDSDLDNFRSDLGGNWGNSNVERVALLNTLERLEKIYGEGMEIERIKLRLEKIIQAEEIKKIATQVGEDQLWGGGVDVKEEEVDSRGEWKEEMGMDLD